MKRHFFILTLIIMVMAPAILLYADDTSIYGSGSISVEPNILIIFDTSGSMSDGDKWKDASTAITNMLPIPVISPTMAPHSIAITASMPIGCHRPPPQKGSSNQPSNMAD